VLRAGGSSSRGLEHERRALQRALMRGIELTVSRAASWSDAVAAGAGAILALDADLEAGFIDSRAGLAVIAAADVLGGRIAERRSAGREALSAEQDLRIGDVVLHEDHGVGVLRALEMVEVDGLARDTMRIEYHGGAGVLAPVEDLGRIWRYGAEEAAVTLDRLGGDAWLTAARRY
jgi:transcription-repair coupling factor (superfamily II helicase)